MYQLGHVQEDVDGHDRPGDAGLGGDSAAEPAAGLAHAPALALMQSTH